MKTITTINWVIIGIYCVLALLMYLESNRSGIDAAGRGMAMGFLFIGLMYLAVLVGLNLINVQWVRILVLFLGGMPLLVYSSRALSSRQTQAKYARLAQENSKFKDPNVLDEYSVPLLYTLIERGRDDVYEKVELLLKHGLDPNIPFGTDQPYQLNYSPVVWAAHYERWAICNLLINNGADVNFQLGGPDGRTFWFILEEKGKKYQASGNIPADYQHLLSNEIIKNSKPI